VQQIPSASRGVSTADRAHHAQDSHGDAHNGQNRAASFQGAATAAAFQTTHFILIKRPFAVNEKVLTLNTLFDFFVIITLQ